MAYNLRKRKPLLAEEKSAIDSDSDFETDTDEGKIFHEHIIVPFVFYTFHMRLSKDLYFNKLT